MSIVNNEIRDLFTYYNSDISWIRLIEVSLSFSRSDKKAHQSSIEEKKHFLEPDAITMIPAAAGKLQQLIRLPPQTDIHEWLATNCEYHTLLIKV